MTEAALRKQILISIEGYNTRLLRQIMGEPGVPMSHSKLEVETEIGRATIQRWEAQRRAGTNGTRRRFRTGITQAKWVRYLGIKREAIRGRLRRMEAEELRTLAKLA